MKKVLTLMMAMIAIISMGFGAQAQSSKKASKVAVYVSGNLPSDYEDMFAAEFCQRLGQLSCFQLLARDNGCLNSIIAEQNYQVSGNVDENEIRKIGRQFGAEYVLDVNVHVLDNLWITNSRLINVTTGKIVYTSKLQSKVNDAEQAVGLAGRAAYKVYQDFERRRNIE